MNYKVRITNVKLAQRIGRHLTVDEATARNLVDRGDAVYEGGGVPKAKITPTEMLEEEILEDVIEPLNQREAQNGPISGVRDSGCGSEKPAKIPNSSI